MGYRLCFAVPDKKRRLCNIFRFSVFQRHSMGIKVSCEARRSLIINQQKCARKQKREFIIILNILKRLTNPPIITQTKFVSNASQQSQPCENYRIIIKPVGNQSEGFLQLLAVHPRFHEFFSVMYHVAFRGFGEAFVEWPLRCRQEDYDFIFPNNFLFPQLELSRP